MVVWSHDKCVINANKSRSLYLTVSPHTRCAASVKSGSLCFPAHCWKTSKGFLIISCSHYISECTPTHNAQPPRMKQIRAFMFRDFARAERNDHNIASRPKEVGVDRVESENAQIKILIINTMHTFTSIYFACFHPTYPQIQCITCVLIMPLQSSTIVWLQTPNNNRVRTPLFLHACVVFDQILCGSIIIIIQPAATQREPPCLHACRFDKPWFK